jgi:hypothetical protein
MTGQSILSAWEDLTGVRVANDSIYCWSPLGNRIAQPPCHNDSGLDIENARCWSNLLASKAGKG